MQTKVVKDQELFFNDHSIKDEIPSEKNIFYYYSIKEQQHGFNFISNCKNLLEYGCGMGTSLDVFFEDKSRKLADYNIVGVDIADKALDRARAKYPSYTFYTIQNNVMPQINPGTMDGAFMLHVLHHSTGHDIMFAEIYSKLKPGGKFFLSDLSSNNPFISFGRFLFPFVSGKMTETFEDDLVVDGKIPDKYKISKDKVISQLKVCGFTITEVGEGHLFVFIFNWLHRLLPFLHIADMHFLLKPLMALEQRMLKFSFFKKYAEVFYIFAVKEH